MKRQEIKNLVAELKGYECFDDLYADLKEMRGFEDVINGIIDEVSKRYAEECVKASLEKASEKATYDYDAKYDVISINKKSITNTKNIVLI